MEEMIARANEMGLLNWKQKTQTHKRCTHTFVSLYTWGLWFRNCWLLCPHKDHFICTYKHRCELVIIFSNFWASVCQLSVNQPLWACKTAFSSVLWYGWPFNVSVHSRNIDTTGPQTSHEPPGTLYCSLMYALCYYPFTNAQHANK